MGDVQGQLEAILAAGVPGAVVVAQTEGQRVEAAAGLACVATGEPLTSAHRFRVGSVTKIFVAALVLRLVDEGILDLDGEAAPFVEGVTIRQLLNHTSGLDDLDLDHRSGSRIGRASLTDGTSSRATSFGLCWQSLACSNPVKVGRTTAATTSCSGS